MAGACAVRTAMHGRVRADDVCSQAQTARRGHRLQRPAMQAEGQATVDLTVTTTINGKLYRFGFWITQVRGDIIRALDPGPELGFQLFGDVGT